MRAIRFDERLSFTDAQPAPKPGAGECLIRVHLAGICATDHQIVRGYLGFRGVLGHEMVGTVVEGSDRWVGKRVACEINCVCRKCDTCTAGTSAHCRNRTVMGISGRDGCFADAIAMPEANLHELPDAIADDEAAFVEPLAAAYQIVRQVPIEKRTSVAVVGSGRLGLLAAQVLKQTGCRLEVIGRNPVTLLFCEKKGIQAQSADAVALRRDRDVVVECTGSPAGLELAMKLVRPRGTIVLKSTHADASGVNLSEAVVNELTIVGSRCGPFADAIHALARKAVDVSSMVSRVFPIERGVEAFEASANPANVKVLLKINPR